MDLYEFINKLGQDINDFLSWYRAKHNSPVTSKDFPYWRSQSGWEQAFDEFLQERQVTNVQR